MNFARPYETHRRTIAQAIRDAKASGHTRYQTTHSARPVDPTRMTESQIELHALREAQRYVERIINQHNEQLARGR